MRFHFYSAARAALTGGDGMYSVGPMPDPETYRSALNRLPLVMVFALAPLNMTFEEWIAAMQRDWLTQVLGYDPQLLLAPPPCINHPDRWSWTMLDGENLCWQCADDWLRGERMWAEGHYE